MRWLNYHHLYYFYRVARAGSIASAARGLRLTHSTLSVQIRDLGEALGGALFEKQGRRLVLTPRGEETLAYAEEIFQLGAELLDAAEAHKDPTRQSPVRIGIVPSLPRALVYRLLEPRLAPHHPPLILRTDGYTHLLEELVLGRIHAILADAPPPSSGRGRTFVHPLGRSKLAFYGTPQLARTHRRGFPGSLTNVPMILPSAGTPFRRLLDRWLGHHAIRPRVIAEVDDAAMLRTLGVQGHGVFPVRLALRNEVEDAQGAELVGKLSRVEETYFAISIERRVRHPFVAALLEDARDALG